MWLALPPTWNVVPALGFDEAILPLNNAGATCRLPVMRMPRLTGSLDSWVGNESLSVEDRLVALAQAFNGLIFLYEHGFEGHGDLKPSNILFTDLRERYELRDKGSWPSKEHPWQIRVADLGWADAWVDLGFTTKALRRYLGPERLGPAGRVVPQKSDIFSMGVIASEILQGRHPAPNVKKVEQSEGKYFRWADQGERILDGISSSRLRNLIKRSLVSEPEGRPSPQECLSVICEELRLAYGHEIEQTLGLWRASATGDSISDDEHVAWAARQTLVLGLTEVHRSIENLERRLALVEARDIGTCESWAALAGSLLMLLEKEYPDSPKIGQLHDKAVEHLHLVLGPANRATLESVAPRDGVAAFERLGSVVCKMAGIAGVKYDVVGIGRVVLGSLAKSAWAFTLAAEARSEFQTAEVVEQHLAESIKYAPDEVVPYYFRAFWAHNRWFMETASTEAEVPRPPASELARWINDLEIACRLSPGWCLPQDFLKSIRSHQT